MNQIEDYIIVKNTISKDLCKAMIDECNKKNGENTLGIITPLVQIHLKQQKN